MAKYSELGKNLLGGGFSPPRLNRNDDKIKKNNSSEWWAKPIEMREFDTPGIIYNGKTAEELLSSAKRERTYSSPPNISSGIEAYENQLKEQKNALDEKEKEIDFFGGLYNNAEEKYTKSLKRVQFMMSEKNGTNLPIYESVRDDALRLGGVYKNCKDRVLELAAEHEELRNSYNETLELYNSEIEKSKAAYEEWKSTIRSSDEIDINIGVVDRQITALEKLEIDLRARINTMNSESAYTSSGFKSEEQIDCENALDIANAELDVLKSKKALLEEELWYSEYFWYENFRNAEDFEEKSKYVHSYKMDFGSFLPMIFGGVSHSGGGFDDIKYAYINKVKPAEQLSDEGSVPEAIASWLGINDKELLQMTDDEVAMFNYLYALDTERGDKEHKTAYGYIKFLTSELNLRERTAIEKKVAEYSKEHPVIASVGSVITSPLKAVSYIGQAVDYIDDGEIDQNAGYNKMSYTNTAVRRTVGDIVEKKWGAAGSFAYNTGMSMADFLFTTAITGGFAGGGAISSNLALGIMGSSAAADTVISARDRGLSSAEAFTLGTVAGAVEIAMEKISLDALFSVKWNRNTLSRIMRNGLSNAFEETGTKLINTIADVLITRDKSEWQALIDGYINDGKTPEEAFAFALGETAANIGLAGLSGLFSGIAIGGVSIPIQYSKFKKLGKSIRQKGDEAVSRYIDVGLLADKKSSLYKLASEIEGKIKDGGVSNLELGRLAVGVVEALQSPKFKEKYLNEAAIAAVQNHSDKIPHIGEVSSPKWEYLLPTWKRDKAGGTIDNLYRWVYNNDVVEPYKVQEIDSNDIYTDYALTQLDNAAQKQQDILTNGVNGGIIKENNAKPITGITDNAISKVPKVDIEGFTDDQNDFIQNQHKDLLKYARDNNDNKEVAFVFRKDLTDRAVFVGSDDVIDFGNGLFGKGDNLFIMHNHPRNSSFSDTDIVSFISNSNIRHLTIVKNNGEIEIISKLIGFDSTRMITEFKRQYKKYVKTGADFEIDKAVSKLLEKSTEDLLWIKNK